MTFDEYYSKLVDQCHMKMSCMCTILETKHTYVDQDTFRLIKPELKIKVFLAVFMKHHVLRNSWICNFYTSLILSFRLLVCSFGQPLKTLMIDQNIISKRVLICSNTDKKYIISYFYLLRGIFISQGLHSN